MFFIRIACNFKNIICLVFIEVTQLINVLTFSDVWGVIIKSHYNSRWLVVLLESEYYSISTIKTISSLFPIALNRTASRQ